MGKNSFPRVLMLEREGRECGEVQIKYFPDDLGVGRAVDPNDRAPANLCGKPPSYKRRSPGAEEIVL